MNVYTPYAEIAQESVRSEKESNIFPHHAKSENRSMSSRRKTKKEGKLETFLKVDDADNGANVRGTAVLVSNLNYLDE